MFSFFKHKRPSRSNSLSEDIKNFLGLNPTNPQIDIWIDDQILFQVIRCKVFKNRNLKHATNDFAIAHFFNKKTHTLNTFRKFQKDEQEKNFLYFEEPKGVHNYIKNIGSEPQFMEQAIKESIAYYEFDSDRIIRIEFNKY